MATFTRKVLYFNTLPASVGNLYAPSTGKTGLAHNLTIHNANSTNEVVELFYKNPAATELKLYKITLAAGDTANIDFGNEGLIVENGGYIRGNTTTAAMVTCKIDGSEEGS